MPNARQSRGPLRRSQSPSLSERLGGYSVGVLAAASVVWLLLSLPAVSALLLSFLQVYPPLSDAEIAHASDGAPTAIVVLSAGRLSAAGEFGGGDTVDALSLERLRYAAILARETALPVMTTGGDDHARVPLADLLADALKDWGIIAHWRERQSLTTAENAEFAADILKKEGIGRVLLVTHAWHMRRAVAAFRHYGLTVMPAPTAFDHPLDRAWAENLMPGVASFRRSTYALHELVGLLWYRVRYGI